VLRSLKQLTESGQLKKVRRKYDEKHSELVQTTGPSELIRHDKILKVLRMINIGKTAGVTGVVAEMIMADERQFGFKPGERTTGFSCN